MFFILHTLYIHEMDDDKGQIAIDFLLGISLFLIALIFTVQFIPGMFMAGSVRESSLDYTAYRTASVLAEDTGWWGNSMGSATDWENHPDDIMRVGLAVDDDITSRLTDSPNLISNNKTSQLMLLNESELTDVLGLYNQVDDTHFAYGYNISITKNGVPLIINNTPVMLGDTVPDDRETSKITRVVLVEKEVIGHIDGTELPDSPNTPQASNTIIDITGPLDRDVILYLTNLNISGLDPSFKKLVLDGVNLNEGEGNDYMSYKVHPNGSTEYLTPTGKIDVGDSVIFNVESGLFSANHTYQLEIIFKDIICTADISLTPEYQESLETYYEPAYLTVEVWQ